MRLNLKMSVAFVMSCSILAVSQVPAPISWAAGPGRIAISHGGNYFDKDEAYALAMDYALLAAYGLQNKLVHIAHSVNWKNDSVFHAQMMLSAEGINQFPGFDKEVQFDWQDPTQVAAGRLNFKAQAEKSSATDKLYFILSGSKDAPYHDIEAVAPEYRKFIVCISYSNPDDVVYSGQGIKAWSDIVRDFSADSVQFIKIYDQNAKLGGIGASKWDFLKNMPASTLFPPAAAAWLRDRDFKKNGDVSSSGTLFYALTSRNDGNEEDFKARFMAPLPSAQTGIFIPRAAKLQSKNITVDLTQNNRLLKVMVMGIQGNGAVKMYNLLNQKVQNVPMTDGHGEVNLNGAARGKYFLHIESNSQLAVKEFFVK